ncbi:MAG: hypothetical protein HPY75_13095 [Actinobacteria bacterium]|nr:hypothetical protein [Actinomycetota bacterium]
MSGRKRSKLEAEKEKKEKKAAARAKARKRVKKVMLLALAGGAVAAAMGSRKPKPAPGSGTVTMRDAEPGPLAFMMGELVKGLLAEPRKKALADKMNVSVAIQDLDNPEMAATMVFKGSDVEVANGVIAGVDIYIGTELALLLSLSGAGKGKQLLQWLKSEDGKKVLNAVKSGRFKMRGALKNASQMALFQKFLTPA